MVIFPVISPRNQAILTPFFLLLLATAHGATALTQALGDTAGAFRTQVQSDPTVVDPRLFLRRYDLVLKLIKKDRLREAAGELSEMREDFTGRSTAYLDYLRARLHLRLGDGLNPARGRSYEWQTTNVSVRPDERYVYFPGKRPSSNTLFIEKRQMPYPLEAKADYDKAESLLTHLEQSPTALLREAALLTRGDLELSRGDGTEADRLWASFATRYPGSLLAGDVLLRRARLAAWEKRWVDGAALLRALARLNPGGPQMGLAEEQARLMLSMTNSNESAAQQITDLLSRWEKESRLGDELSQVLDALNPVLGTP